MAFGRVLIIETAMPNIIIDRGRGPEIAGTRITVFDIVDYLEMNWHHSAIAAWLRLSSNQVLAAMRYIEEHKTEVMAEYQEMVERAARGNPADVQAKIDASHERFLARLNDRQRARLQELEHEGNSRGQ